MVSLVRWRPRREIVNFNDEFNRMFDNFFVPARDWLKAEHVHSWNPAVDILDKDDHIVITAELPGVDKKDLTVDVKDRVLTLKGERSSDNEDKEDNFYRRERFYGKFERSFTLPTNVDPDNIKADYKDGVLNIKVPKPEQQKPKQITVH